MFAPDQAVPRDEPPSAGLRAAVPGAVRVFHSDLLSVLALQFAAATAAAAVYALEAHEGSGNLWLFTAAAVLVQLTLFTVAWKLRNAAEPLAAAALLLPVLACVLTSEAPLWPVLLLLVTLTGYLVLRAVRADAGTRAAFTLAARTAALPAGHAAAGRCRFRRRGVRPGTGFKGPAGPRWNQRSKCPLRETQTAPGEQAG